MTNGAAGFTDKNVDDKMASLALIKDIRCCHHPLCVLLQPWLKVVCTEAILTKQALHLNDTMIICLKIK
jgi:hypothetical protein